MSGSDPLLVGTYEPALVTLSVVLAILASYAALDLAGRIAAARGTTRLIWLAGSAIAMGVGIWSMHYIGMLAFTLPVTVKYDWPTVGLSLLAAVLAAAVAMFVTSRHLMTARQAAVGSVFMGGGIASMHYIGMAAMRLPAMCIYSPALVALSVLLAVAISFVALRLTFKFRDQTKEFDWRKIGSAIVMGFTPLAAVPDDLSHAIAISSIGIAGITVVTFMVLSTAFVTSVLDRRFSAFAAREEALREHEAKFRAITETANDAIVSTDSLGTITYCNPAAERLFGYSAADANGKPVTLLMPEHLQDAFNAGLQRYRVSGEAAFVGQTMELSGRRKDGTHFPLELSVATWKNGDNAYCTGILRDLTERKEAEAQLTRHRQDLESQRIQVFRATMTTVQDIVNNFLGNMQLIRMEADGRLPDNTLVLFDSLILSTAAELRELGSLQTIREKEMEIGTGIDYARAPAG